MPDVFEAVLPLITGSAVRAPAMTTAAYCAEHPALAGRKDALAELLADTAAVSPEPRERAVVARLFGMLGRRPEDLLHDEHPGVRACAALAPGVLRRRARHPRAGVRPEVPQGLPAG